MVYVTSRLLYSQETTPVPTEQEAGWDKETIWTISKEEQFLTPAWIFNLFNDPVSPIS
jgi:hypothetical protein